MSCGKKAQVEMEGEDTELDKTIIEAVKDPLTHLVRNAVDHGIETPAERRARGKPEEGRLFLRAFHEGGQVNIEISDDGAGIDPAKVKQKAIDNGLASTQDLARLSDRELLHLIFLPGFSMAEKVSNISGRGVGMDVVKTNIEKIGGTVDVQSKLGRGTTFKLKIPLTLAIIPALLVTTCNDRYAIPQINLLELLRLEGDQIRKNIEMFHNKPVYRLRGKLLPLIYLDQLLELDAKKATNSQQMDSINIVVLQAADQKFGLVVDEVIDTEEIVVKPLSKQLKHLPFYSGATIMGDGKVSLILDILGIAQRAGVLSDAERARTLAEAAGLQCDTLRARSPIRTSDRRAHAQPKRVKVVAIGVSTGGPNALEQLMPTIPEDFPVPIVIVQHMPPVFTRYLAERLAARSAIEVQEGVAGTALAPGMAWIAPGDSHMVVKQQNGEVQLGLNQAPLENSCRPAVDVLFRSVARVYGAHTLAVVMTGMGKDGLRGCEEIRSMGGQVIVQDRASSVVWGMPGHVAEAGLADKILPLSQLGPEILRRTQQEQPTPKPTQATF